MVAAVAAANAGLSEEPARAAPAGGAALLRLQQRPGVACAALLLAHFLAGAYPAVPPAAQQAGVYMSPERRRSITPLF